MEESLQPRQLLQMLNRQQSLIEMAVQATQPTTAGQPAPSNPVTGNGAPLAGAPAGGAPMGAVSKAAPTPPWRRGSAAPPVERVPEESGVNPKAMPYEGD